MRAEAQLSDRHRGGHTQPKGRVMQQVSFNRAMPGARIDGGASADVPQTLDPWRAVRRSLTGRYRLAIVLGLWCALIGAPLGWWAWQGYRAKEAAKGTHCYSRCRGRGRSW